MDFKEGDKIYINLYKYRELASPHSESYKDSFLFDMRYGIEYVGTPHDDKRTDFIFEIKDIKKFMLLKIVHGVGQREE